MTTNNDRYLIGFLFGTIATIVVVHILIHNTYEHENMFPPLVKPEYIIEVDGDSAFVQNRYGDVYRGQLSDIDSIIVYDNL